MRRSVKPLLNGYGGSNPSLPTQVVSGLLVIKIHRVIHEKNQFWSVRLMVRTLPFQGRDASSILVRTTKNAGIAQWSEQDAYIVKVGGSSPSIGTKDTQVSYNGYYTGLPSR